MDGTLAALYALLSLLDMGLTDCREAGCLARSDAPARLSFQAADVQFNDFSIGNEIYIGYDFDRAFGPFQPTLGASFTEDSETWIGYGVKTAWTFDSGVFIEGSIMPGLYYEAGGIPLGGNLQFRSAIGVGYEFGNGATLTVLYDHRSNADTQPLNPGLETLSIRYAVTLD